MRRARRINFGGYPNVFIRRGNLHDHRGKSPRVWAESAGRKRRSLSLRKFSFGVEDTRDLLNSHLISPDATDDTERGLLSSWRLSFLSLVQDINRAASYYEDLLNDPRIASKSLRLSTLLYHHVFKYEISFLSSLSVWAAFMSIFYRARLYMFVSKLYAFAGLRLLYYSYYYYYFYYY